MARFSPISWTLLLGTLVLTPACLGGAQQRQSLQEAVFEYTHGVRWGRHDYVTRYLASGASRYLMARERLGDLRVTKCRVTGVKLEKKGGLATVTLTVNWFRLTRGTLRRTMVQQQWKRKGERWQVVSQGVLGGAMLPIFPNPAAQVASPAPKRPS